MVTSLGNIGCFILRKVEGVFAGEESVVSAPASCVRYLHSSILPDSSIQSLEPKARFLLDNIA